MLSFWLCELGLVGDNKLYHDPSVIFGNWKLTKTVGLHKIQVKVCHDSDAFVYDKYADTYIDLPASW